MPDDTEVRIYTFGNLFLRTANLFLLSILRMKGVHPIFLHTCRDSKGL